MSTPPIRMRRAQVPEDAPPPLPGETPWYAGTQTPIQPGVYKRLSVAGTIMHSLWDSCWHWNHVSAERAALATDETLCATLPWRGLLSPPPYGYGPVMAARLTTPADSEGGAL